MKRSGIFILVTVAALLKLLIVWQLADHPLVQPEIGLDSSAYAELAKRVVAGDWGLGPGLYYVSPLYIYVLAAGLALTDSFTAVRVLQVRRIRRGAGRVRHEDIGPALAIAPGAGPRLRGGSWPGELDRAIERRSLE